MESQHEEYLSDVAAELQRRGADNQQISEAVAEVAQRLQQLDGDPGETLGAPGVFAEQWLDRRGHSHDPEWEWRTFRASAIDEMDVVRDAGRQGWELVDVGFYALHCRRPRKLEDATQWEYSRRISLDRAGVLETMTGLGWTACGVWFPWHYFKRNLEKPAEIPGRASS
ncbi:MAG TPA: hypothetical protein VKZ96_04750 [Thermomicrobiales bacterium]|nr:hypothetical protein [Thermomicrobiales bacterium]